MKRLLEKTTETDIKPSNASVIATKETRIANGEEGTPVEKTVWGRCERKTGRGNDEKKLMRSKNKHHKRVTGEDKRCHVK